MLFPSVNLLAVLIAALANLLLGFTWYSKAVMGKTWMKLMGYTDASIKAKQSKMGPLYGLSFMGALVQAALIAGLLQMTYVQSASDALILGAMVWLGFIAVTQLTEEIFNIKSFNPHLLAINTSYQLLSVLVMSLILYWWQ